MSNATPAQLLQRGWTFVLNAAARGATKAQQDAQQIMSHVATPFLERRIDSHTQLPDLIKWANLFQKDMRECTSGSRSLPFGAGGVVIESYQYTNGASVAFPHRLGTAAVEGLWSTPRNGTPNATIYCDSQFVYILPGATFTASLILFVVPVAPSGPTGPASSIVGPTGPTGPTGAAGGYGTYAGRPSAGNTGARYICSDPGIVDFVDSGSAWRPLIRGTIGTEVAPGNSIAAFTQVGYAAPDTANVQAGCLYFAKAAHGGTNSLLGYEFPKSSGQTLTAHLVANLPQLVNTGSMGVWVRDSAGGKLELLIFKFSLNTPTRMAVQTWTTLSNAAGTEPYNNVADATNADIWFRIVDTGSALQFWYSSDGANFARAYTDAVPFVPSGGDRYGIGFNPASMPLQMTVDSFLVA